MSNVNKALVVAIAAELVVATAMIACNGLVPTPESPIPTPAPTSTPYPGQLMNGGFEGECIESVVHLIDNITRENICTPVEWVTWWRTGHTDGGELGQPEVKLIHGDDPIRGYDAELPRLRSGDQGIVLFTMWRPHEVGLYQCLCAPPGTTMAFSAYAQAWTCNDNVNPGYTCVHEWDQVVVSVGIDPKGMMHPYSRSIEWSDSIVVPDSFHLVGPVTATVGTTGRLCIFLRSEAKWGFEHLDAYWDDAVLLAE